MSETIFSKIIRGEIPCKKAFEDDQVLAFHDIKPQAPVHVLIIPKQKVIPTTDDITQADEKLVGHMVWVAGEIARQLGLAQDGYRLVFNCRGNAGQVRVPGKHGSAPRSYEVVAVLIDDQPGQLARIFADAGAAGVNIEDVRIEHATGQQAGLVQLMVEPKAAVVLTGALRERGWAIRQ